jgi:hypothetical protein
MRFLQSETKWSPRSQQIVLQERRLQGEMRSLDGLIEASRKKIAGLETDSSEFAGMIAERGAQHYLYRHLRELAISLTEERALLAAYEGRRAATQAQIDALVPNPETQKERARQQERMARRVADRLVKDGRIGELVESLRQALKERGEISGEIAEIAEALEMTLGPDALDHTRFEELQEALPEEVFSASKRWSEWFLGPADSRDPKSREGGMLIFEETLADAGVHFQPEQGGD